MLCLAGKSYVTMISSQNRKTGLCVSMHGKDEGILKISWKMN